MPMFSIQKTPDGELGYGFDWTNWLIDDAIDSSSWEKVSGGSSLIIAGSMLKGNITLVKLSGGETGKSYTLKNTISTTGGKRDSRLLEVLIVPK